MSWRLLIAPRAQKELTGLPARDREAMSDALSRVSTDPSSVDLRKLQGQDDLWRVRVGRWRAILRLDGAEGTMRVLRVVARSRAYRD
ncbi:MAG: type II toxin-antitoxin system RelE/ParE family toxin [Chloroflexota bacterium]|nr:type II toxin-antitoxin system RelE/ParE family toxin [Chloroflexota bacterium]